LEGALGSFESLLAFRGALWPTGFVVCVRVGGGCWCSWFLWYLVGLVLALKTNSTLFLKQYI